ncbi:hypothetical protein [Paenibacillus sp. Soil724D2]|uniref:hypothetical protein n=1 Tax=Paenibacillus sp. (strain Soil724D2) TaxID=1736392 RepID=UPI00071455F2|nr:hypothetical protein [Paenibacillus sp. Soil724D2]KRE32869.1 hypothetical protein ASG85_15260 [Paenibacillus sp. Soil724D2]
MERIFPICEATVMPYVGMPICAVLHDGTHYYGTIEGIDGDRLIINGYIGGPGEVGIYGLNKDQSAKKKSVKKAKQVKTSAFLPGFGFERFFFPFAALAFLFAIPFLGFPFFF